MHARKILLAGSTGATGRTVLRIATPQEAPLLVPLVRPRSAAQAPAAAVLAELSDAAALANAMGGCTTVVQLIGTMRRRFGSGDTYEASDIGTTRQLVEAAKGVGTVDHIVLLSSVGAGQPMGAYLRSKAEAERIVRESGMPCTVLRPSAFVGEGHAPPRLMVALADRLAPARYRPIRMEELARLVLHVATQRACVGEVLEGASLWRAVEAAGA